MSTTHFGFQSVDEKDKARHVRGVFDSVASKYDVMNDLMSGGLHRAWKAYAVMVANLREGSQVLDIAGGTGDLSLAFARNVGATVSDSALTTAGKVSIVARDYIMDGGTQKGSRILAIAGQVGVSKGKQAGAALGVNVIANKVQAGLVNSDLTQIKDGKGGLTVTADSLGQILGITASVAVSISRKAALMAAASAMIGSPAALAASSNSLTASWVLLAETAIPACCIRARAL